MRSPDTESSPFGGARWEWRIASDVREITSIVEAIASGCRSAGFEARKCRLNVPVALTEAITNAIENGNGSDVTRVVHIVAHIDERMLCVEVSDEGPGFDAAAVRARAGEPGWVDREDGRGVFLMHSLMDGVEYLQAEVHTVRLVLRRT